MINPFPIAHRLNLDYLGKDKFPFLKDRTVLLMRSISMKSNSNQANEVCQGELIAKVKISGVKLMTYMKIYF